MKLNIAKKIVLGVLLTIASSKAFAQQDAMFSQYMVNHFVINPAYAGSRDALSTFLLNRNQWMNIPGAPQTSMLTVNSPISKSMGLGAQFVADQIGPKNSIVYMASYSYRIRFNYKSNLAFGLRAGGFTYRFNWNKVEYKDVSDVYANQGVLQQSAFNTDFGVFYYTKKFYTGLSFNHITNTLRMSQINIGAGKEAYLTPHIFLATGYTFEINKEIAVQPSIMMRQVDNAPVNTDLNCNILFNRRIWLGVSIRPQNAIVILTQAYVTERFRLGYAYDMGVNKIGRVGRGAHEIFLGYDFSTKRYKNYSPRYF